uniref:NADH dehydrogenase subunit 6 n=1 Tax=Xyloplax princealberti TaxID=3083365 RepID=UPI002E773012|nr:NADH dehydrogenase subunit 6 [Xyloplax princealberti]WQM48554.1 NADH dehydrogenase subunit 6 [Xyloplax princealberti]
MIFYLLLVIMFFGGTLVFYSLSPYYGALGLVMLAISSCFLLGLFGFSFVALVLVLIYMGGMLVVFIYSIVLSSERYPKVSNLNEIFILAFFLILWVFFNFENWFNVSLIEWNSFINIDLIGNSNLYNLVWWNLIMAGYILLITLIVVLILTYGSEYNILKAL